MYEYKVVNAPASPRRGWFRKASSFAETLCDTINEMALDNWEYQRAECGLASSENVLIFRKKVEKAEEKMGQARSFSDRLLEAESKTEKGKTEAGRDYSGPVRPRRARVLLDQAGTITDRPESVEAGTIDLDNTNYEAANSAADRVTPFKPKAAASANA